MVCELASGKRSAAPRVDLLLSATGRCILRVEQESTEAGADD